MTIWFNPEMCRDAAPTGKPGRRPTYSDAAVQTCSTMKVPFGMGHGRTPAVEHPNHASPSTKVDLSRFVPLRVLVLATFLSKATGLSQPNAECRWRGL